MRGVERKAPKNGLGAHLVHLAGQPRHLFFATQLRPRTHVHVPGIQRSVIRRRNHIPRFRLRLAESLHQLLLRRSHGGIGMSGSQENDVLLDFRRLIDFFFHGPVRTKESDEHSE